TIVNLAPSLQYWHTRGKPFDEYKSVGEAEVYGLRIRHLIGPIPARAGVWRVWAEKEASAHFPGNDYTTDRLGIVPSIGFLVLMVAIFRPHWLDSARYRKLQAAADLNLVLVLVATIGGFGSLF